MHDLDQDYMYGIMAAQERSLLVRSLKNNVLLYGHAYNHFICLYSGLQVYKPDDMLRDNQLLVNSMMYMLHSSWYLTTETKEWSNKEQIWFFWYFACQFSWLKQISYDVTVWLVLRI